MFTTFENTPFSEGAPFVLNSGGIALATGFRVAMGNGDATPLRISTTGLGVYNGSNFYTETRTAATANRIVTYADGDGGLFPAITTRLGVDATNATTVAAAVAGFTVGLEANAEYEFEGCLRVQSAATTTGFQFTLTGPSAQTDHIAFESSHIIGTTLTTGNDGKQLMTAFGGNVARSNSPVANATYPIWIKGIMKTTGTLPATPVGLSFQSSTNAVQVTLKAGSYLRFRKTN